jgi:DNA polymerase-1
MSPTIVLIDGENLIFRSFFAVPPLSTTTGIPTNAVYGCLKTFKSTINELRPDYVINVWGTGKKTFRHELDPNYKAHRPPVSNDLKVQFSLVQKAFDLLGVPQITPVDNVECDDLIGTIAKKASDVGMNAIIVSSDKDFFQLCNDQIRVWSFTLAKKTGNGFVNADYVRKEYGVEPDQLNYVKSLVGEKTDNIQGVKGIGPKTATSLIQQHGNIDNLLNHLKNNPNHKNYTIFENKDVVDLALKLAIIKTDVQVNEVPVKPVDKIKINAENLRAFFKELEMKTFLSEFAQWNYLFGYKTTIA